MIFLFYLLAGLRALSRNAIQGAVDLTFCDTDAEIGCRLPKWTRELSEVLVFLLITGKENTQINVPSFTWLAWFHLFRLTSALCLMSHYVLSYLLIWKPTEKTQRLHNILLRQQYKLRHGSLVHKHHLAGKITKFALEETEKNKRKQWLEQYNCCCSYVVGHNMHHAAWRQLSKPGIKKEEYEQYAVWNNI